MKNPLSKEKPTRVRILFAAILCVVLALVFELLLSNFHSIFTFDRSHEAIDLQDYCESDVLSESGIYTLLPSYTESDAILFADVPCRISSVSFEIRYTDETIDDSIPAPKVTLMATDPRTTWENGGFIPVATNRIAVGSGGEFASVTLHASIDGEGTGRLRLSFDDLAGIVELRNVQINQVPAFSFSFLHFLLLALAALIPAVLSITGLLYASYDKNNPRHRYGVKTAVLFTVVLAFFFAALFLYGGSAIEYPLSGAVRDYHPYIQQFDAFMKGQLHLDVPIPDELLALENPYDFASRVDADPLWDRAYFDGKYYSYFGITPVLLLYFPYYAFSGMLPSDSLVISTLLLITAIFIPLTVLKWVDLHEKRNVPLPVVWLGAVTAFVGSLMLLTARSVSPFYYIATLSANAFLSLFLYLLLKAAEAERLRDRVFFYVFAGISYALVLHSRLNVALLAAFIVVPYLIFRVLKKHTETDASPTSSSEKQSRSARIRAFFAPPKEIAVSLTALGVPVLAGLVAILVLNKARFGSILEFGTSYQLTVSDIRYNTLSIGNLAPALYHYFFQTLEVSPTFPYLSMTLENTHSYGHYVYTDASFGLFALPLPNALLLTPFALRLKNRPRYEKVLLLALLLGLVTVALLDFSLGGVIFRYVIDLTLPAALGAVFLLFALVSAASEHDASHTSGLSRGVTVSVLLFLLLASAAALLLSLSFDANLTKYSAEIFVGLQKLFSLG